MRKVAVIVDRPEWAFDRIAKALGDHAERFEVAIFYLKNNVEKMTEDMPRLYGNFDLVFFMHWSMALEIRETVISRFIRPKFSKKKLILRSDIDLDRTLVGIHSHDDWDDHNTRPDTRVLPPTHLVERLAAFKAVNTVSRRLYGIFTEAGLDGLYYTPNGVDDRLFTPTEALGVKDRLRVGCTGKPKRDWNKGLTEFIKPLSELPFIEIELAGLDRMVPYEEMAQYYNGVDVFVCSSASEGFSLSVLEASACGRPVVSTRVGGSEDLIENGVNGFLIDRDFDAIKGRLALLHEDRQLLTDMGERNRETILANWTWAKRVEDWLTFIEDHLP